MKLSTYIFIMASLVTSSVIGATLKKIDPFEAVKKGSVDEVRRLIESKEINVNAKGDHNQTLLMSAVNSGPMMVRLLIDNGANVNAKNDRGNTALMEAIENGGDFFVVDALVRAGTKINEPNNNGDTSLTYAAKVGSPVIIAYLIRNGADVKAKGLFGKTALTQFQEMARSIEKLLS